MLGTRTKHVFSYGRRSSRIVNVSDRRDQESADNDSSNVSSDEEIPPRTRQLKRENAIILSPAKPRVVHRRTKRPTSTRSPGKLPSAPTQSKAMQRNVPEEAPAKRIPSKLEPNTHVRQPLTPLRLNGTPSNDQPAALVKGKAKAAVMKASARTSLKPRSPVIAVDIIVLDEHGSRVTQERRLSHTEVQTNPVRAAPAKGKSILKTMLASPPPIAISDDSDPDEPPPKPIVRPSKRKPKLVVVFSDESEAEAAVNKTSPSRLAKSHSRSKSLRMEVVIPPAPFRTTKAATKPPPSPPSAPHPHTVTPLRTSMIPAPSFQQAPLPSLLAPPLLKTRQLTPIRGNSSRSIFRRPPPTPSTPTDGDLSLELAQLDLSDVTETDGLTYAQPQYLVPLLNECAQTSPFEFSAFIETFPFDPVVQSSADDEDVKFRKIGEASYSEVFGIGDVVLKIIPIRNEEESARLETGEIPAPSDATDVLKEIAVTREIGELCNGFVNLLKAYVVRGKYPSLLLDLWDEYNERKGSESIRPDSFGLTQVYVIIILPNGGPDLESFTFKSPSKSGWHQACGVFWQVARALGQAEELVNFEHRDLHWGQILVKNVPVRKSSNKGSAARIPMDDTRFGVQITIIDLGLSRMDATDGKGSNKTYWTTFDDDIFEGEGDYQYDVYRMMRELNGGVWKGYEPVTNVMWLHYLVLKLLHEKRLKAPGSRKQTLGEGVSVTPAGYSEEDCYSCLVEMEKLLGNCVTSARKGQKGRRKTVAPLSGPRSARDVIAYGIRQGWVR